MRSGVIRWALVLLVGLAGCAPKLPPAPTVVTPRFPDFVFPAVPPDLARTAAAASHQRAWLFLQAGDLRTAERVFATSLKQTPGFYPAEAGLGYVQLAQRDYTNALARFDRALTQSPRYAPALVGRGEALLASDRSGEALQAFETALSVEPALSPVQRRVEVLRFRGTQEYVAEARRAADAGRDEEARRAYERAIAASPDSAFLYRELAAVEQRQGNLDRALEHAHRAVQLDPADARALVVIGDILEARGDFDGAIETYRRALAIEPSEGTEAKLERARERVELARLPDQYKRIGEAPTLSRGELAALLGVRLADLFQASRARRPELMTDTRGHWAAAWIMAVTSAGAMEVYPNHTFQPGAPVRRGDLAQVTSRVLGMIAQRDPALGRGWQNARLTFADVSAGHLIYTAASRAVAAGVLPMLDGNTFQLARPVAGAEAVQAVAKLEQLVARIRGARRPVAAVTPP